MDFTHFMKLINVTIAFPVVLVLESSEIMIVAFYFFFILERAREERDG